MEFLRKVLGQISDFFLALNPAKRFALVMTGLGIMAGLAILFVWAAQKTYVPLRTNLNSDDSAQIIRILREKKIPFRVDPTGKNIEIPPENVFDLRLDLATMGLPQTGGLGYEIFDKQSIGTTSFVQRINQKRALEGELMRTISSIRGIKRSRVHLVLPEKSAFIEDQKKPSASVVLELDPSVVLEEKQVYGIGMLVSSSVEGLDITNVAIVDSNGKPLSKNGHDPIMVMTASQLDVQRKIESELEKKIEAMLSRVVGEGKVVARVTADLDFNRIDETQTLYDQEGSAVHSVQKNTESMEGVRPGAGGGAGAAANTPGNPPPAANPNQIRNNTQKSQETTNYQVPQTIRKTQKTPGTISRLSVAVMLDQKWTKTADAQGKVEAKAEPWSPEKVKEFEGLVVNAAGLNLKRGDTIDIRTMEFTQVDFEEASRIIQESDRKNYIQNMVLYGVLALVIMLFFFFVVKPFIKWVTENTIDSVDTFLPQTIEELEKVQKNTNLPALEEVVPVLNEKMAPEKVEGEMIKEKITTLIESNPYKAAMILKDWIREPALRKAVEKDAVAGAAPDAKGKSA